MTGRAPMLINLPPPPSDPTTPSEMGPGTPNSATTSLSALSVVAIKDGTLGHSGHSGRGGGGHSANTLEAERNDRISRLAGLERVATVRQNSSTSNPGIGAQAMGQYFDHQIPQFKERSTVGSASATGSVGARTTWASESVDDVDKMSEDGQSSMGGFSDEDKASLVGFGEGANSTMSGPVSTANTRIWAARQNQMTPRAGYPLSGSGQSTPMSGIVPSAAAGGADSKMTDGVNYDSNIVDSSMQSTPNTYQTQGRYSGVGVEMAEGILRDQMADTEPDQQSMSTPDSQHLGKFAFERESR